jgi:hypothetical protein
LPKKYVYVDLTANTFFLHMIQKTRALVNGMVKYLLVLPLHHSMKILLGSLREVSVSSDTSSCTDDLSAHDSERVTVILKSLYQKMK